MRSLPSFAPRSPDLSLAAVSAVSGRGPSTPQRKSPAVLAPLCCFWSELGLSRFLARRTSRLVFHSAMTHTLPLPASVQTARRRLNPRPDAAGRECFFSPPARRCMQERPRGCVCESSSISSYVQKGSAEKAAPTTQHTLCLRAVAPFVRIHIR
uniref:Uncharacterized protein n=1 Tax=Toxoplasma gondii COUG TaxID=1074873 RepID=A0A2G8Y0L5_TOXGO|nr:hypothetical protein TGCOUG_393440 [Toxoplasma gondii COUG]